MKTFLIFILIFFRCIQFYEIESVSKFDDIVNQYIKIGNAMRVYYPRIQSNTGPGLIQHFVSSPGMQPKHILPKDSINLLIELCKSNITKILESPDLKEIEQLRANWILANLKAVEYSIQVEKGKVRDFDEESFQSFGIRLPIYIEQYFKNINLQLDSILSGNGTTMERYNRLSEKFIIPQEKIETVFRKIIEESRTRTKLKLQLPEKETAKLVFIKGKRARGGCYYKGNNESTILINQEFPIDIFTAVEVACHEGYPGHHVYNLFMDQSRNNKKLTELSFSPLFGPQGFMTEAIASSAREMVFSNNDLNIFVKQVLLPIAGIDTTDFTLYCKANLIKNNNKYLNTELSRGFVNGSLSDQEILRWLTDYSILSNEEKIYYLETIKNFRSRIASYSFGADIIRKFLNTRSQYNDEISRWEDYKWLLSNPTIPQELKKLATNKGLGVKP
jgi:hypothetical protein